MKLVQSFEEIQCKIAILRNLRKGFVSNFYPDEFRNSLWISKGQLQVEESEECDLYLYEEESFCSLYYVATTIESLNAAISKLLPTLSTTMVTDLVGMEAQIEPLVELFKNNGFTLRRELTRMSCIGVGDQFRQDEAMVQKGDVDNVAEIRQLLVDFFDPLSEQLPSEEELMHYIENNGIYVCRMEGRIAGFIIFELTKSSFYLRHWFTHPGFRNKGVGSALYKKVMYNSADLKRLMLWVVDDNENAIKRYEHYGYKMEKLRDKVMIYNN